MNHSLSFGYMASPYVICGACRVPKRKRMVHGDCLVSLSNVNALNLYLNYCIKTCQKCQDCFVFSGVLQYSSYETF